MHHVDLVVARGAALLDGLGLRRIRHPEVAVGPVQQEGVATVVVDVIGGLAKGGAEAGGRGQRGEGHGGGGGDEGVLGGVIHQGLSGRERVADCMEEEQYNRRCPRKRESFPTTNGGMQNGSSVEICARCIHVFAHLAPIYMLSRCLLTKISASELSRKFIKSALLAGYVLFGP